MTTRNEESEPSGPDSPKRDRRKSTWEGFDPLHEADAIDWWQERRWVARAFCQRSNVELIELAKARVEALPTRELMREKSSLRKALETEILERIQHAEACLASELEHVPPAGPSGTVGLTEFAGWGMRDLGKLALGGSSTAAAATAAVRTTPVLLGMVGLGAVAPVVAPIAATGAAAAFAWSAISSVGGKRPAYLKLVQDAVTGLLTAPDVAGGSVLSRHLRRIDEAYRQRIENAS